jgi:hypothetical protein
MTNEKDNVNSPEHYKVGGLETIDIIQSKLTLEEYRGFLKGNIIKYTLRSGYKYDTVEDLKKAKWYLDRLIVAPIAKILRTIKKGKPKKGKPC